MENEKGNKFLFTIAVTLLAVLIIMVLIKTFLFDKNKKENIEVPESLINELYSYIDIKKYENDQSFYAPYYLDGQNISPLTVARMTYNYINKYDNIKFEAVTDEEKKGFEDGNIISKIKIKTFEEESTNIINKTNFTLNYYKNTKFDIDDETSAFINNDYLYIYKRNDKLENNMVYYHGLVSYTLMDEGNTIVLTEYFLLCDKNTNICYDDDNKAKNNSITYSNNLDASTMTDKLKKYSHTFKKVDEEYKWFNVEPA